MCSKTNNEWFNGVDRVVADEIRFKIKLAIGEDAYTSLRLKNKVVAAWDIYGVASSAASAAKSAVVAETFFASSGWLSSLGIGSAVSTPLGWVIAAGLLGGTAYWGITQYFKSGDTFRVNVVPEFINTPLDVLALGLFDLFAPIALKIAYIDREISETERLIIRNHFIKDWGYDEHFIDEGLCFAESRLSDNDKTKLRDLAETMAQLAAENPDCNYKPVTNEVVNLLKSLLDADTKESEIKELAIEKIESIFEKNDPAKLRNRAKRAWKTSAGTAKWAGASLSKVTRASVSLSKEKVAKINEIINSRGK
jgi:hypothetical protein